MANSMGNALHWPQLFTSLTTATVDFVEVSSVYCTRATHWGKWGPFHGKAKIIVILLVPRSPVACSRHSD